MSLLFIKPSDAWHRLSTRIFLQSHGIGRSSLKALFNLRLMSHSQKDCRFNRIFECCYTLVHHIDDIKMFVDKFPNIINGLSVIDRTFLDMEILKPLFGATSLLGIHAAEIHDFMRVMTDVHIDESIQRCCIQITEKS